MSHPTHDSDCRDSQNANPVMYRLSSRLYFCLRVFNVHLREGSVGGYKYVALMYVIVAYLLQTITL